MYMYGGVHACLPTCMWRPKADMMCFLDKSSPYILRQDLSLKIELSSSAAWASQFAPGLSVHLELYACAGESKLCSHVCMAIVTHCITALAPQHSILNLKIVP